MALADYTPPRLAVPFKGGEFSVRGLALDDLALLMRNHYSDINALVDVFAKDTTEEQPVAAITKHAVALIKEAPGLVANLIAIACDEPDAVDNARKLMMPVQVRAIETIAKLTFEEAGGPKKFMESLANLLRGMRPAA